MPKSEAIIFGRSPFIHCVNVPALLPHYTTYAPNKLGKYWEMDHVVWYDEPVKGILGSPEIWVPWQWTESQRALGTKGYVIASHDEPICAKQYNQAGYLHVGMRYFCASMAVNIALLQGHTAIYLIGIDHVETNQRFEHYDINDQDPDVCFTAASHRGIKDFIAQCNQHVPVYQCNPVVANDWPVPYKNIEELYA